MQNQLEQMPQLIERLSKMPKAQRDSIIAKLPRPGQQQAPAQAPPQAIGSVMPPMGVPKRDGSGQGRRANQGRALSSILQGLEGKY